MRLSYGTAELEGETLEAIRWTQRAANQEYEDTPGLDSSSNMDCSPHQVLNWLFGGTDIAPFVGEERDWGDA